MVAPSTSLSHVELATMVAPVPLKVTPLDPVTRAIGQMALGKLACGLDGGASNPAQLWQVQSDCVLVFESKHLVGIVTQRDLVHLAASGQNLCKVTIADVMSAPVLTLKTADFADVFVPLTLFEQHHIHHLPLVDDQGNVVGMVIEPNLKQALDAIDWLQDLTIADVMIQLDDLPQPIVQAPPTATLADLAQLMSAHHTDYVVIGEACHQPPEAPLLQTLRLTTDSRCWVTGIITQREIVRGLALELDFATVQAQDLIPTPIATVSPETPLQTAQQLMQTQHPLIVSNDAGEMLGLVTQIDLLRILDPSTFYHLVQRNYQKQTLALKEQQAATQLKLQNDILEQIARARPLFEILEMLLQAMELQLQNSLCSILLCDRDGILHCGPAHLPATYLEAIDGIAAGEGVGSCGTAVVRREPVIVSDIASDPLWETFRDRALPHGLKACWSFPILASDGSVLGTFGVYYRESRTPQSPDLESLSKAANLAGIAIEREQERQTLRQLNQDLESRVAERTLALHQANLQLQNLGDRLSLAVKSAGIGIWEWDLVNNIKIWDDRMYELYGIRIDQMKDFYQAWVNSLHPDDRTLTETALQQALQGEKDYDIEFRVIHADRSVRFLKAYGLVQRDSQGKPLRIIGVNFDITDRKQIELSLRKSEERWHLVLQGTNAGIWDWDVQNQQVFFSSRWKAMRGLAEDEVSDRPEEWSAAIHPEDYERVMTAIEAHFGGETEFFEMEYRVRHKDGSYFWILDRGQALRDASGRVIRMSGAETDITQRKLAEAALQASEERYRQIVETQTEFVIRSAPDTTITFANTAICRALGRSPEQLLGQPWRKFIPVAEQPPLYQKIAALSPANPRFEHTNADYRPDNKLGWTQWVNLGIFNQQGELVEIQSVGRDITQLHETEDALRQSEERFRNAFNNTAVGMALVSAEGRFLKVNLALCKYLGYSEAELITLSFQDITYPADLAVDQDLAAQTLTGERESYALEKRFVNKQGQLIWGSLSVSLVRNSQGQPLYFVSQTQDINDRKLAEQQLQDLSERLDLALQAAQIGVWEWDVINDRLFWDDRMFALYGIQHENFGGQYRDWEQYVHPDDLADQRQIAQQALRRERDGDTEFKIIRPDKTVRFLSSSSLIQQNQLGEPQRVFGLNIDITDRKQAELALQSSEARFRRVFDSSVIGMVFANFQGQIMDANDRFLQIVGYTRVDLAVGLVRWDTMTPPEYAASDQEIIQHLRQFGSIGPCEKEYYRKDGRRVSVLLGIAILPDTPDQVVSVVLDISDRKRLEQAQQRLNAILEASTDYISMSDAVSGHFIWNNAAMKQLCGIESDAAAAQPSSTDYHPQWAIERLRQEAIPAAIATGSWLGETALLDAQGQEIPVSELLLAHKSPQGQVEFFSSIMRDMRIHKEYEQRLERTNAELRHATHLKDEFLANMSHELRTPLNAILGMAEALQEQIFGEVNQKQLSALKTIERTGIHLLALINDILDLAKVESGQIELNCAPTAVMALCQSSLDLIKPQALKKQIQLELQLPNCLPDLYVDERRIRQVLVNLLNNAVKFTPNRGCVTLKVSSPIDQQTEAGEGQWLRFAVLDTGIGIAPENIERLFQPFVQIDSALNRQYEGTGLGLALVKQIVELHSGQVALTSQVGVGSCFTIDLPVGGTCSSLINLQPPSLPQPEPAQSDQVISPLILLVEDNEDNIITVATYLEVTGNRLLVARNGEEALALVEAENPDLILMDIQMPGIDGLEAIQRIRQLPNRTEIPIIALTALAMEGDRERCLAAGANDYLCKPVKLKQLVATIQQLLRSC